jgi:hypothetical protein
MREDNDDGYRKPYHKPTQTSLNQNHAEHIHTAMEASQPTPPQVVDILGPHVTPNRPTKPPEPTTPAALLKNIFFAPIAPTNNNGSKNSESDWELDIDNGDPPPELLGTNPHSKAIVKMLQDHRHKATSKILSLCRYPLNKMKGHSDETLQAFQWERGQRENALMSLREQNEKKIAALWEKNEKEIADRQAALMSIWEGIAKDIANTHRANNKLLANLAFIKHLMDTNTKKNQLTFDKIAEN